MPEGWCKQRPKTWRKRGPVLIFLKRKQFKCDNINNSIIEASTSLSLIIFLVAIDLVSSSPQKAVASYSDFVVITWGTTNIQLIHSRCPCCLVIALHPSSLIPQSPKIFWLIPMSTRFTRGQPPPLICRQPLSPILFPPELRSSYLGLSPPAPPRPPSRGACSPSRPPCYSLHIHKYTQPYLFEPPPSGSAEGLAGWVPHLVVVYFSTKVLRLMASRPLRSAWLR